MNFAYLVMILCFFAPALLVAQTPILDKSYKVPIPKLFVISQSDTPAYVASQGEEQHPKKYEMGELFFGIEEKHGRILLGKYDEFKEKFTEQIGWVSLDHILTSRYAQTVGEVVKQGLLPNADDKTNGMFSIHSHLFFKVFAQPELKISISSIPDTSNKNFSTFTWYYVMDCKKNNSVLYYLLCDQEDLFDTPFITNTDNKEAKRHLLGWVPADRVKPYPTSFVLEYNTSVEAITERYRKNLPGIVYNEQKENSSTICASESLNLWKEWMDKGTKGDVTKLRWARPDPYGLAIEIPRFYIMEQLNHEWYKVGTLATNNNINRKDDVEQLILKFKEVIEKMPIVDICFVVDGGSTMLDEIETVKQFCLTLGSTAQTQKNADYVEIENPFTKVKHKLYIKMNIRASLIVYRHTYDRADSTEICFQGISLETGQAELDQGFKKTIPVRYNKNLHVGLYTALTAEKIWRPDSIRFLVVIGDKRSDPNGQYIVLQNMPLPSLKIAKEIGIDIAKNPTKLKQEYTKIVGIYTAPSNDTDFPEFQQNLNRLTDIHTNTFWVPDFSTNPESKKKFVSILESYIQQAEKKTTNKLLSLILQINPQPSTTLKNYPVTTNRDDTTIADILKESKITYQDIQQFDQLIYVEGFVKIRQTNHSYDTFRKRILMSKPELIALRMNTSRIYHQFKKNFETMDPSKTRKQAIAESLVLVIGEFAGTADEYVGNPTALTKAGKELIREAEGTGGDITIRQKINMYTSLPQNITSILDMPLRQVIILSLKDILVHTNRLNGQIRCMDKILNGEIAPEITDQDFSKLDDWEKKMAGENKVKEWFVRHPVSGMLYTYIPIEYLQ